MRLRITLSLEVSGAAMLTPDRLHDGRYMAEAFVEKLRMRGVLDRNADTYGRGVMLRSYSSELVDG